MDKLKQFNNGFTLVELLIAISIIAIISSIGYVNYDSAKDSARDSRRKKDLVAVKTALVSYYQDNQTYPPSDPLAGNEFTSAGGDNWIPDLTPAYIQKLPKDPKQAGLNIFSKLASILKKEGSEIISPALAAESVITVRPNGPGTNMPDQWTPTGCILNWQCIDEATLDGSDYLSTSGALVRQGAYATTDPTIPGGSIINRIDVYVQRRGSNTAVPCAKLASSGSPNCGTPMWDPPPTANWSTARFIIPSPGWTVADMANLELVLWYTVGTRTPVDVAQGWIEIRYTPSSPTPAPTPTPIPTPTPTPTPTPPPVATPTPPPPPTGCANQKDVYCYIVDTQRTYFILWAQLDKTNDPEAITGANAICKGTPPSGTTFNYCLESPQ